MFIIFEICLFLSLLFSTGSMVNEIFTTSINSLGSQRSLSFKKKYVSADHWNNSVSQKQSPADIKRLVYLPEALLIFKLSLLLSPLPCGLRCTLAKDCNIFKVEVEKCTIGQFGPNIEYADSGVEVYVDGNLADSNNKQPTCNEGWSVFEEGSIDLI